MENHQVASTSKPSAGASGSQKVSGSPSRTLRTPSRLEPAEMASRSSTSSGTCRRGVRGDGPAGTPVCCRGRSCSAPAARFHTLARNRQRPLRQVPVLPVLRGIGGDLPCGAVDRYPVRALASKGFSRARPAATAAVSPNAGALICGEPSVPRGADYLSAANIVRKRRPEVPLSSPPPESSKERRSMRMPACVVRAYPR